MPDPRTTLRTGALAATVAAVEIRIARAVKSNGRRSCPRADRSDKLIGCERIRRF